jgi:uncharacterized membrane protein YphA (DoxX/SURF4 family)
MPQFYSLQNDWKTICYFITRLSLGMYLLIHAIINLIEYQSFIFTAREYVPLESPLGFLANFTPIVPLLEFFLALMIILGLYTRISLIWAIVLGVFFTFIFHFTGDLETALTHAYSLILKVGLFYSIYYNKYSADYYNVWSIARLKEKQLKEQKEKLKQQKVRESLQGL